MAAYINLGLIIVSILADAEVANLTITDDKRIASTQHKLQATDIKLLKNYKKDITNINKRNYKPTLAKKDIIHANNLITSKIKNPKTKILVKKDMDKYKKDLDNRIKTRKNKNTKKQTKKK